MTGKILVTGSSGFVGKEVIRELKEGNYSYVITHRKKSEVHIEKKNSIEFDLSSEKNNLGLSKDISTIIHCAGIAHGKSHKESDIYAYNYRGTKKLLDAAIDAKISHFIFLSSVSVYGLDSCNDIVKISEDIKPKNAYGRSKLDAENYIINKCSMHNIKYTILRLPLIFGKDAPGNFGKIIKLAKLRIPVPFGQIVNNRSMVYINNLADFLVNRCVTKHHENEIILFEDKIILSTADIINLTRKYMNSNIQNLNFNEKFLSIFFSIFLGKKIKDQLFGDLVFSTSSQVERGWTPKYNKHSAFKEMLDSGL